MICKLLAAATIAAVPAAAFAQESAIPATDSGDTTWILVSSALVLLMTLPGLVLCEGLDITSHGERRWEFE